MQRLGRADAGAGGGVRRDWQDALAKVAAEGVCRVCGSTLRVEAAHVIGRARDRRRPDGIVRVDPDSVVPLCGPATSSGTCHGRYDAHELDLAPYLTAEEGARAVLDAGGLWAAVRRVSGRPTPTRVMSL